jgi:eukaryotic-like serine/threonine-protein kinase
MAIADRYEVKATMGEGGFSRVYLGEEKGTGREVALKVLKSGYYKNAEVRERFQREVFAVASLSNPHIVGMYDFDLNSEDLYIAMEYVAGKTLRERVRDCFTMKQRVQIISQIAEAIDTAHSRNVLHRDLKPENVKIIEEGGQLLVKVLDFGMAKLTELEQRLELAPLTRVGICFGTPQYMSPEQIRGKLDDRSIDLYALAIISYELISGSRPWDGAEPYEVMRAVLRTPAPPLKYVQLAPDEQPLDIDRLAALNEFFGRALSKRPGMRPSSAHELVIGLELALFGEIERRAAPVASARAARSDDTLPAQGLGSTDKVPALKSELLIVVDDSNYQPGTITDIERLRAREIADAELLALAVDGRAERSWRRLVVPVLVIAALGGSVGWLIASGGSAEGTYIHEFLVGKP